MTDDMTSASGADHYDDKDSDDDSGHPLQQRAVKRRRIVASEEDGAHDHDGAQHDQAPSTSAAATADDGAAADDAVPSKKSRARPTASSRSAAEKDKRKLHVEDAKNTPSIMSFFGQPKRTTGGKEAQGIVAGQRKTAGTLEAFFGTKTTDGMDSGDTAHAEVKDEEKQRTAEASDAVKTAEPQGDEQKDDAAKRTATAAERNDTPRKRASPARSTASAARMEMQAAAVEAKPVARKPERASGKPTGKPVLAVKRAGPMSKMKRKQREAGGDRTDDDDEAQRKHEADMQDIADKEEAAIEEEDAAASSSSEDEDHSDLARELAEYNQAATEEKITQEEDAPAASPTSSSPPSSLLGTASYHPVRHASWSAGQPVPYAALCSTFAAVEAEGSRLRIIAMVSDFLRSVIALTPADLLPCIYLCINAIAPAYEGKETGVGDFILKKVIANTTGMSLARLRESAKDVTDLGVLALAHRKRQVTLYSSPPLTVRGVFAAMQDMAAMSGKNVGAKKEGAITKLMVACKGEEAKYLVRSLQGSLRIGLQSKSVIAALARALVITPPAPTAASSTSKAVLDARQTLSDKKFTAALEEGLAVLKQAYTECPNLSLLISAILQYGLSELPSHCSLRAGIPVEVMLGRPASSIMAILDKFSGRLFTLEYKYDGERAQVHRCKDGSVRIYSRNSEDNTPKYPDVAGRLRRYEADGVDDYILDAEMVAWDSRARRILPFQALSTRKRKDVREEDITVQVMLFAFDLLYLNGQSLLQRTLRQRREALHTAFVPVDGELAFATHLDTADVEEISSFLQQAVQDSCEGLMVKPLDDDSQYTPGKRGWLKCKKDYLDGVGDTLDLVPIAAFYGKGKRTGHYGAYVLAVYDEESEQYQSVTKIGTGFSEADIARHAAFYNDSDAAEERLLPARPHYYAIGDALHPDVWLGPVQVWEVKCADISISPVHQAAVGRVEPAKGLALRFPRFVRVRDDKRPEDATSSEQLVDLYHAQSVRAGQRKANGDDDD